MKKVGERIFENYDSAMYAYNNYFEYAYVDSSKKILSTVQINSLHKQSGMHIFSKLPDKGDIANYLLSGTITQKQQDLGVASFGEMVMGGGNAYSSPEPDRILQFGIFAQPDKPEYKLGCFCSVFTKLKDAQTYFEVKDTTYNQINCFLLRTVTRSTFVLNSKPDEKITDEMIRMHKELTGNWDTCHQTVIVTDIINKKDYAVLHYSNETFCSNNHNEHRSYSTVTKYKKTGNYYYREYYEKKTPRFFPGYKGGFNDRDLYTLIIYKSSEAKIDKYKELELNLKNWDKFKLKRNMKAFLKKE